MEAALSEGEEFQVLPRPEYMTISSYEGVPVEVLENLGPFVDYICLLYTSTGKRNPRLGEDFLVWADADNIVKIILNTYKFVERYISPDAPARKEHIGYIIDRVGFEEYKKWALDGVELMPETIVKQCVYWNGIHFDR